METYLGEERAPYRFYIVNLGGLDESLELVGLETRLACRSGYLETEVPKYSDVDAVIGEDESGI